MPKYLWLVIGTVLALGGLALVLYDYLAAGIALLVVSTVLDLLFVRQVVAERSSRTTPR